MDFISHVQNFDILLFGETWINRDDPVDLSIPGFECAHVFAKKSRGAKVADQAAVFPSISKLV